MKNFLNGLHDRVFGLDILRAAAILLVLYSHRNLISATDRVHQHFIYLCGFWGVELFFVLSGFLIGSRLIVLSEKNAGISDYLIFWKKRWARTLPLYFIILGLYWHFSYEHFPWKHIFFLQNSYHITDIDLLTFNQSWSLAIEEYAYLLLPILLLVGTLIWRIKSKKRVLVLLLGIVLISLVARIYYAWTFPTIVYDNWIRKSTFLRIDAIAIGMLVAWVKFHYQTIYYKLSGLLVPLTCLTFILVMNSIGNVLVSKDQEHLFFPSTFGFTLVSLSLAFMIPFFDKNEINNNLAKLKLVHFWVTLTAMLSYCIYLIHIPIYEYFYKYLDGKIPFKVNVTLMLMTVYSISLISYFLIERPFQQIASKIKNTEN